MQDEMDFLHKNYMSWYNFLKEENHWKTNGYSSGWGIQLKKISQVDKDSHQQKCLKYVDKGCP